MAELADAPDLGSGPSRGGGSSPPFRISANLLIDNHSDKHVRFYFDAFLLISAGGVRLLIAVVLSPRMKKDGYFTSSIRLVSK